MTKLDKPNKETVKFPFGDPEELAGYLPHLLLRLSNRWSTNQSVAFSSSDITNNALRIMSSLSAHGELTINELSALSVIEQSTTSRTIEHLVKKGHVARTISSEDQRVRKVVLTPDGEVELQEIAPVIQSLYGDFMDGVEPDDLETCIAVLQTVLKNVKQTDI